MKFTYNSGQRVLDAYTLKRGIGRGGFGEVYYAVSDAGKDVALKLLRGQNLDIELRGMGQCLNLKHPNLLSLIDIKKDNQGDQWVVMEYITGEPLSTVLSRHPQGLPSDLAKQWIIGLCRAVSCLHDHGIVHRDLKPGNIFVEDGIVKVGDYGLSKFMSGSQHLGQTQSVGTVHYMAPEIASGNYGKQIDVYAAGIILYEMLTGQVPFDGESTGEILMKHLTSPPDLSKLPMGFVGVVSKALAKNPAHRYQTTGDFVKALDSFGPETPRPRVTPRPENKALVQNEPVLTVFPVISGRTQLAELCGSLALTPLFAGVFAAVGAALGRFKDYSMVGSLFFLTVAVCWAVLIPAKLWTDRKGNSWARRWMMMGLGLPVGLSSLWLEGWMPPLSMDGKGASALLTPWKLPGNDLPEVAGHLGYFGLAFFALRWWKLTDRNRGRRFSFVPVFAAMFWSFLLTLIGPELFLGAVALVLGSIIVQLVSPWEEPPPKQARPVRLRYA